MSRRPCPRCGGFVRTPEPYVQSCMNCGWLLDAIPTPVLPPFEDTPAPDANERQKLRARVRAARRLPAHPCRYCGGIIRAGISKGHHRACYEAVLKYERLIAEGRAHAFPRPCVVCGVPLPAGHRPKVHEGRCRRELSMLASRRFKARKAARAAGREPSPEDAKRLPHPPQTSARAKSPRRDCQRKGRRGVHCPRRPGKAPRTGPCCPAARSPPRRP